MYTDHMPSSYNTKTTMVDHLNTFVMLKLGYLSVTDGIKQHGAFA